MKPTDIAKQAAYILTFAEKSDHITEDPAALAAVLHSAAEVCTQVRDHNNLMLLIAHNTE